MKVLLTGASGFVGRHIVKNLVERGASIRATCRGNRELPAGIDERVHVDDLFSADKDQLAALLDGVDLVIHAAWYVEHGDYVISPKNLAALAGTVRLAEAAIEARVPRFVGLGTCFEYDFNAPMPLSPDALLKPATPYGAAKAAAFSALSSAFSHAGLSFGWARLFYLHGEGEDPRRFAAYIRSSLLQNRTAELSSGRQIRDYIDVSDASKMIIDFSFSNVEGSVNICSGVRRSVRDLAIMIAKRLGKQNLLRFDPENDRQSEPHEISGIPFNRIVESNDA